MSNHNTFGRLLANLNTVPPYTAATADVTATHQLVKDGILEKELDWLQSIDFGNPNALSQKSSNSTGKQNVRLMQDSPPSPSPPATAIVGIPHHLTSRITSPINLSKPVEANLLRDFLETTTVRDIDAATLSVLLQQQQQNQLSTAVVQSSHINMNPVDTLSDHQRASNPLSTDSLPLPSASMPASHLPIDSLTLPHQSLTFTSSTTDSVLVDMGVTSTVTKATSIATAPHENLPAQHHSKSPGNSQPSTPTEDTIMGLKTTSSNADEYPFSSTSPEENKRRRNTAASARFRMKKKTREKQLEQAAQEMTDRAASLEGRVRELEMENRWLRGLIVEKNSNILNR